MLINALEKEGECWQSGFFKSTTSSPVFAVINLVSVARINTYLLATLKISIYSIYIYVFIFCAFMCSQDPITGAKRDMIVIWMIEKADLFKFNPETWALGVTILDRFLHTVKVCQFLSPYTK